MKKTIISSLLLLGSTSLMAQTSMCFIENHSSMSTVESTPLNGGACAGKYSINDMKAKGWSVDDIKISQTPSGMNFIYVLKSADHGKVAPVAVGIASNTSVNQEQLEANIMAKLEAKKVAEEKVKVEEELKVAKIDSQAIYVNKCQSCHGEKGETVKSGFKALRTLSTSDMEEALKDYALGRENKSSSVYGPVHVNNLNEKTIKGIKAYLDSINK